MSSVRPVVGEPDRTGAQSPQQAHKPSRLIGLTLGFDSLLLGKKLIPSVLNLGRETNVKIEQLTQKDINLLELCLTFLCRHARESQCCDTSIQLFQWLSQRLIQPNRVESNRDFFLFAFTPNTNGVDTAFVTAPSTANSNGRQAKDFCTIQGVIDRIVLVTANQHLVLQRVFTECFGKAPLQSCNNLSLTRSWWANDKCDIRCIDRLLQRLNLPLGRNTLEARFESPRVSWRPQLLRR